MILHDDRQEGEIPLSENEGFRDEQGWKYFRNAASCLVDLMFGFFGNLMAVQAICGLVGHLLRCAKNILTLFLGIHPTNNARPTAFLHPRSRRRTIGSWNGAPPQTG